MGTTHAQGKTLCPPRGLAHLQATLPPELLASTAWLPWLALPRENGRTGKVPSLPRHGALRPVDCRGAGLPLPEAHGLARRHGAAGVGLVLAPGADHAVLDLDAPLTSQAQALLQEVPGYAEHSPGRGVHVWLSGTLGRNRRQVGTEVIGCGFVTVTGDALSGRGRALGALQPVLARLDKRPPPGPAPTGCPSLADHEVLQQLYSAANGSRARQLLGGGDWAAMGYYSASEADFAAVRTLRFYTSDAAQLARLMWGTALRRPKWGRDDYLERTVRRALEMGGPVWRSGR